MRQMKTLRPDAKGRITLGRLSKGVSGFRMSVDDEQRIILEPFVEIPAREKWLFENPVALADVRSGIEEARHGKVSVLEPSQPIHKNKQS